MQLTFCGAARSVTGSCYLMEVAGTKFLVDCGCFQGSDENIYKRDSFPFEASEISFMLLTHAHIDHSGRIPLLVKKGFSGKIYCTNATKKLSEIMLLDSAHIQEMEAEWGYKKAKRGSGQSYKPLYDTLDAEKSLKYFSSVPYKKLFKINDNISFRFQDAGHLLGSCHIELFLNEKGVEKKVVFSGDIGNINQPLIKNPTLISEADIVITESTYGDRFHQDNLETFSSKERALRLSNIIDETFKRGGNLIIPSFAVGRTQEMLYLLHIIYREKMLNYQVPVFVDSPMAIKATGVFAASTVECYDDEAKALIDAGENPLHFPTLLLVESSEDSKKINDFPDPCVIISSSGMCNAGRIKHHLKYNLWRKECTILFTGYQANGTLGRSILDGAASVKILSEKIDCRAQILKASSLSGHADQRGILNWIEGFDSSRLKQIFVVHGEERSAEYFAGFLTEKGKNAYAPAFGESFDLLNLRTITTEYKAFESNEESLKIDSALTVLNGNFAELNKLFEIMQRQLKGQNTNEKKKVKKIVNRALYFAGDIEDFVNKWKYLEEDDKKL